MSGILCMVIINSYIRTNRDIGRFRQSGGHIQSQCLWGVSRATPFHSPIDFVWDSMNFLVRQSKNMECFCGIPISCLRTVRSTRNSQKPIQSLYVRYKLAPSTPHNAFQFKMAARLPKRFTVLSLYSLT